MKRTWHMAKAGLLKHKGVYLSLFAIIVIVSALLTICLSLILGVNRDLMESLDRQNGQHSLMIMPRDKYNPSFEDIIKNDSRVSQYEINEVIFSTKTKMDYGGEINDFFLYILNLDADYSISPPNITEQDDTIARNNAIFLPSYAKSKGYYRIGDALTLTHRNKAQDFTVAGFFDANEFSTANGAGLKFLVYDEGYQRLRSQMGSSVWLAVRFHDPLDSVQFNEDFQSRIDTDFAADGFQRIDVKEVTLYALYPSMAISAMILAFTILLGLISLIVIRSRVINSIEGSLHTIGVQKASGYTDKQIIGGYLMEYAAVSLPAALAGVLLSLPAFFVVRNVLFSLTGISWTLGANPAAGLTASLAMTFIFLVFILRACRKIKKMSPVDALRGGMAANTFRRNFFPLHTGAGNVQTRLGLKNTFAWLKLYIITGTVIAGATLAITFFAAFYQYVVIDQTGLLPMMGYEFSEVGLTVARHTDADAIAAELEQLPEVRKTSMFEFLPLAIKVDGMNSMGVLSNDFERLETIRCHEGRFPQYDNETAVPKLFADELGKEIGDSIKITANGVAQEYIITGFFSTMQGEGGRVVKLTLEGYQRMDPNYRRGNICVYLNNGVTFEAFSELLKQNFGVVNVYRQEEKSEDFAAAKVRAEEKIAHYLEYYDIDSVDYAVLYNGEMILSGSTSAYQIEKIMDIQEEIKAQTGAYKDAMSVTAQMVTVISLGVIALIFSMTVRQIVARRRYELGIMKSAGFTTQQLVRQLTISFLPSAGLGVIIGGVSGAVLVNPAFTAIFSSLGVYNANIYANPWVTLVACVLVLGFACAAANLSAKRIKQISVYELLSE